MGRESGRTKSRPSSSSLAASLSQGSGAVSPGFGGYVGSTRIDAAGPSEDAYQNVDGESAANLRRLSKKDPITKLKAISALTTYFQEHSAAEVSSLLPCWVFEYKKLVQDNNRQVREATQKAMTCLATTVGRALAPHLRSIMGAWWMSHFDPFYEVSDAAKQALQVAFPGQKKRVEALLFCAGDILAYIDENLKLTPQTISDKATPLEESVEKLERVVSSSLLSLSALLNISFATSPSDANEKVVPAAVQLFKDHKMFQGLMKSGSRVRSGVYEILRAYVQYVPQVISKDNMDAAIKLTLGAFLEKDAACHQPMWDMILVFTKRFGQGWDARKVVHQRFWAFLRHGCYGSQTISYPCLLPLLSLLPPSSLVPAKDFFLQFFSEMWKGREEGAWTREDGILLLKVAKECFMWIIEHEERFSSAEDFQNASLRSFLVESVLFGIYWRAYMDETSDRVFLPGDEIGSCIVDIAKSLDSQLLSTLCTMLQEDCLVSLYMDSSHKNARMLQFFLRISQSDEATRTKVLNIVLKPFLAKGFAHVKTTEGPEALKLVAGLISAYGPIVLDSLAVSFWKGAENSEETEERLPQSLADVFSSKRLQYLFRTELLPWSVSGSHELKIRILMALLESETFSKEWEYVLATISDSEDSVSSSTLSILINALSQQNAEPAKLERWRSSKIDQKVLSVASANQLLDSSSYNLIRAALQGVLYEERHYFLLSEETLLEVMRALLRTMFLAVHLSKNRTMISLATSIVPGEDIVPDLSKASYGAARAAFDIMTSSYHALSCVEGSSGMLEQLVAGFFCLRWTFARSHETDSDETETVVDDGGESALAKAVSHADSSMISLCRQMPGRRKVQEMLISGVKKVLSEVPDSESAASWILDCVSVTCFTEEDNQKVLDMLFARTSYWPVWSTERPLERQHPIQEHLKLSSVVNHVGRGLGRETMFLGDGRSTRAWVIVELICAWNWSGGSAEEFIYPFLQTLAGSEAYRAVLDDVLQALFNGAADSATSSGNPFLRGLLGALRTLFEDGGPLQRKDGEKLFADYVLNSDSTPALPMSILPYVLDVLMPSLLKGTSSGIDVESPICSWLSAALNGSSLYSVSSSDDMQWMHVAIACFPLETSGGAAAFFAATKADISQTRRNLLLFLLRKHIFAASNSSEGALEPSIQLLLARLIGVAVAYSWSSFGTEEWTFVIGKTKKWIEDGAVTAEEKAEAVVEVLSDGGDVEGIKDYDDISMRLLGTALNIFYLMQAFKSMPEAAGTDSLRSLEDCHWSAFEGRSIEQVLRLFLATGLAESISCADEASRRKIALRRVNQNFLWDRVADIALSSSARVRESAVRAADLWGLGKTAVSALYALLFSPHPLSSLQWVSYKFLSTDPLQHQAVSGRTVGSATAEDDQSELNIQLESASDDVRPELSSLLNTPAAVLLESGRSSTILGQYYLAWTIFLSHLRTLDTTSLVRERLLQYVKDSDVSATLLDCLVQHFPLKRGLAEKKGVSEHSHVAEAAKRSATTGSVLFAAEGLLSGGSAKDFGVIAGALYGLLLRVLPACVQTWFAGLRDRSTAAATEAFTTENCSVYLLAEEFNQVQAAAVLDENLTIKANRGLREVTAVYKKEEAGMDIVIRLPTCYPLKPVEVDSTKRLGKSETRVRKWTLSMASFLRNQNGLLYEAVMIWKRNVDREFEGVEECPICYSIIHTTHHCLPRLACKTCKHKFHGACLYKWFSTSHKSTCPLCQTPF